MRKHFLIYSALGACLGLLSFGAKAGSIDLDLSLAAGSSNYSYNLGSMGSLGFSGWEYDLVGTTTARKWTSAKMTYKANGPIETGLGVACNPGNSGNKCGQKEIGSTPWQMITMDISALTGYSSLSIGVGSVDGDGGNGQPETAYLFGALCTPGGLCTPSLLGSFFFGEDGSDRTHSFSLSKAELSGFSDIWVTPFKAGDRANNGNILLSSLSLNTLNVPEPAALGVFGLGVLMIGLFAGLRRRSH